jgi:quinol monooxygenase YgiN
MESRLALRRHMRSEQREACRLEIEFILKPGKRREFSRSCEDLQGHEGDGHIRTTVYEDRDEPGHMLWVADWTSRGALEGYMRTDKFGVLVGGLRVLSVLENCRVVVSGKGAGESSPALLSGRTLEESTAVPVNLETPDGSI